MLFSYASCINRDFPELTTRAFRIEGLTPTTTVSQHAEGFIAHARQRIALSSESELPEIQAWRRAFAKMGLKPTQYRCASEALLRRLRKEGDLPTVIPLVDLCNAVSVTFAIPIAAIDLDKIDGNLQVRPAIGTETYETFSGDIEYPEIGEIIFADDSQRVHARRWVNRQSGYSAVMQSTAKALIVVEAMHTNADADISQLMTALQTSISAIWPQASIKTVQVS